MLQGPSIIASAASAQEASTLARFPLFARLSLAEVSELNARCVWRRVNARHTFASSGEERNWVSIVVSGRIRIIRIVNGREIILHDVSEGNFFGEISATDGVLKSTQAIAMTDAVLVHMPVAAFREAMYRYPSVCDHVMTTLSGRIRALSDRFSEGVSLGIRQRLCAELLRLSRRTASDRIAVSPPPTHSEIAARIGSGRERVTRVLNALEREGVILRSRGAFALTDPNRLREIAMQGE